MTSKAILRFLLNIAVAVSVLTATGQELIEIGTRDQSMYISAQKGRSAVLCHWGEKIKEPQAFLKTVFQKQPDTDNRHEPQLYPAFGGRFILTPALKLTHADGVQTTELVYDGSEKTETDSNRTVTEIRLKDKLYPVWVKLRLTAYREENIIVQQVSVSHTEKGPVQVENIASAYIALHSPAYYLTHFHGTWAHEMQQTEEKLTPGIKVVESKKGVRTTQSENPSFLISLNSPAAENSGEVYAGALAWSGNYKLAFEVDEYGILHISAGMNPFASVFSLEPGEELKTPDMVLAYSPAGKGPLSRNLHDWCRRYSLAHGDLERPVVLNSWEGAYFDFDENRLATMIDDAAGIGVEMFVLDDGWFGNKYPRNSDAAGLGDWQVNKKKLPGGIHRLASRAVSKGMKFGIWIEPEMVNPDSELARRHPEWIVKSGKRDILPMRNQWVLDLTNPQVQDFVFRTFDRVVSLSPHISYIKWDANRHIDNFGSEYLPPDRQTRFWYEYVKGLYSVYERIRQKYPHIQIQLCSSGGGRLDFGALGYHDEFWASDNTNALDRIFIQYGSSLLFPAMAIASHVSTSPNHQTGMISPLKFRFDVAMSGRLGLELQPKDIPDNEYDFARNAIASYKKIRPVVQFGDLYRFGSPYDENGWYSLMYVSKNKKESVFFGYSLKYHPRTACYELKLDGLDPGKHYRVKELNALPGHNCFPGEGETYTGDYLMKAGVKLFLNNPFDSIVLHLTEV